MIHATLERIRVDLNIMEHRSRAHEDELSAICNDVSTIQASVGSIAGNVEALESRASRAEDDAEPDVGVTWPSR